MTTNKETVAEAFAANFPGRLELIDQNTILDGAHNVDKIRFLIRALNTKYKILNTRYTLVVAFKKGKNWKKMLSLLVKNLPVKKIIATKFNAPTDTGFFAAVEPSEIKEFLISNLKFPISNVKVIENSLEAVFEALNTIQLSNYPSSQLTLVTGSLYLVGEARTLWYLPEF